MDEGGNAFVTGFTRSSNFPTTPDAWQPKRGGGICDVFQTPCSDAFVTKIAAEGPGVVPDVSLSISPTSVPVGGTLTATWAGIPRPSPQDRLGLVKLGWRSVSGDIIAVWPTTGEADGRLGLMLPKTLPPGSYELRLLTTVDFLLTTLARSSPFRVAEEDR